MSIRQDSRGTMRVKISSINFAQFSNDNRYLVPVGCRNDEKMFEMQKVLSQYRSKYTVIDIYFNSQHNIIQVNNFCLNLYIYVIDI